MGVEMNDIELFKKVVNEMGISLKNGKSGITVEGVPLLEYLKTHNLFELDVDSLKKK